MATVTPTGQQSKKVMGENTVTMTVDVGSALDLRVNDYVDVFTDDYAERYFLLDPSDLKKNSSIEYNYTITFKGWQYLLDHAQYLFPDSNNEYTLSGQTIMGNLDTFVDLLITNANRDQIGWVKGTIDETDFQELTFDANESCLSVLATLYNAFKIEYWVDGQTIHFTKMGVVEDFSLKYGMGNGLYNISRAISTNTKQVTRLYVYGSTKNIPADYKGYSDKLKLPGTTLYIEKNVYVNDDPEQGIKYGVIEDTQVFDNIYPHRTGLVTTVADDFTFTDSEIDFDVNVQQLGGDISPKITFNTGLLAGYTFDVHSFDNTTKTFVINQNQDDKAFIVPNDDFKPQVGDQYVITDIAMPDSYIEAAENELLTAGQDYLNANCNPIVTYTVECDPLDFKRKNIHLKLGNYVPIQDDDFDLDDNLRIIGFTRDLQIPSKYVPELADTTDIQPTVSAAVKNEVLTNKVTRISKSTNLAYNNALQAKATADAVKEITDFWGVTIDEEAGIVASGTLLVGAGAVNNAGMTGVVDAVDNTDPDNPIDKSVRFWAGATYADKDNAPWRVTDDGRMTAKAGQIANFLIDDHGLINTEDVDAYIIQQKSDGSGNIIARAAIGTNVAGGDNRVGDFINHFDNTHGPNYGVFISVKNGSNTLLQPGYSGNFAGIFEGDIDITGGLFIDNPGSVIHLTEVQIPNLPETTTMAGFGTVVARNSDGKLFINF